LDIPFQKTHDAPDFLGKGTPTIDWLISDYQ